MKSASCQSSGWNGVATGGGVFATGVTFCCAMAMLRACDSASLVCCQRLIVALNNSGTPIDR